MEEIRERAGHAILFRMTSETDEVANTPYPCSPLQTTQTLAFYVDSDRISANRVGHLLVTVFHSGFMAHLYTLVS